MEGEREKGMKGRGRERERERGWEGWDRERVSVVRERGGEKGGGRENERKTIKYNESSSNKLNRHLISSILI